MTKNSEKKFILFNIGYKIYLRKISTHTQLNKIIKQNNKHNKHQWNRMISDVLGQSSLPNKNTYPQIKDQTVNDIRTMKNTEST